MDNDMKMFFRKAALSIVQGCFFILSAIAAPQDFLLKTLDVQTGLSDNCVNDLLCDSDNFLWIGTNEGLDFYDGSNIVHFDLLSSENGRASIVFALAEDSYGAIWVGTSNGLFRVIKGAGSVQKIEHDDLDGQIVRHIACTSDGILWISLSSKNLVRVDAATLDVSSTSIASKSLCVDSEGGLYVLTDDGQILYSSSGASEFKSISLDVGQLVKEKGLSRIIYVGGKLFLSDVNGAPFVLDLKILEIKHLPFLSKIRDVLEHSSGELWVAARDGVHVLENDLRQQRVFRPYHDNSFRALVEDKWGGVWAGTLFEGMARICPLTSGSMTRCAGMFRICITPST